MTCAFARLSRRQANSLTDFTTSLSVAHACSHNAHRWIFVEDEGRHVGRCHVPDELYEALRQAPLVIRVQCSRDSRLDILVEDYSASASTSADGRSRDEWLEKMKESVGQLRKRFGDENGAYPPVLMSTNAVFSGPSRRPLVSLECERPFTQRIPVAADGPISCEPVQQSINTPNQ